MNPRNGSGNSGRRHHPARNVPTVRRGKIPMRLRQHVGLRYGGATIGQLSLMDHGSREGMGYAASIADGRRGIDRDAPFHGMTPRRSSAVDGVDPNGVFSVMTPFRAGMRERDSAYVSQCHGDRWSGDLICVGAAARPPWLDRGGPRAAFRCAFESIVRRYGPGDRSSDGDGRGRRQFRAPRQFLPAAERNGEFRRPVVRRYRHRSNDP